MVLSIQKLIKTKTFLTENLFLRMWQSKKKEKKSSN